MAFDTAALDVAAIGQGVTLLSGDCRTMLPTLAANSVQCCVTSPPYYGLRDYGTAQWEGGDAECDHRSDRTGGAARAAADRQRAAERGYAATSNYTNYGAGWTDGSVYRDTCGKCGARRIDAQIGLEATPDEFIAQMVAVFREVRRVLRDDGTLWLNLGDSYAGNNNGYPPNAPSNIAGSKQSTNRGSVLQQSRVPVGLKPKDLMMMPARVALALQADGWWLRSAIVWAKPNPMPESVTDRPTSAYEMVYLLTKRSRYFYDADAVREEAEYGRRDTAGAWRGGAYVNQKPGQDNSIGTGLPNSVTGKHPEAGRNCRNVWTIATSPFSAAHFATFPPELAERCIKAGSKLGDTILDPFAGAGTALLVADRLQRHAIGIELNTAYTTMAMERCRADAPLFSSWPPAEDPADQRMAADAMQRDLFGSGE